MRREATGDHLLMAMCVPVKFSIWKMSESVGEAQYWDVVRGKMNGMGISVGRYVRKFGKTGDQVRMEF